MAKFTKNYKVEINKKQEKKAIDFLNSTIDFEFNKYSIIEVVFDNIKGGILASLVSDKKVIKQVIIDSKNTLTEVQKGDYES